MAKKKNKKNEISLRTVRQVMPSEALNLSDIADFLSENYNEYAQLTTDMPLMESQQIAAMLDKLFEAEDVEFLMTTSYGQGLLMGAASVTHSMEEVMGAQAEAKEEEKGEELDAEEIEEIVRSTARKGPKNTKGSKGSSGIH